MKKIGGTWQNCIEVLIVTFVLVCMTFFYKNDFLTEWDRYSEVIPIGKMIQMQNKDFVPGNFMGVYTEQWGDTENYSIYLESKDITELQFMSYPDQIGIHGVIWGGGK